MSRTFKRLTFEDRLQIETLLAQGLGRRAIGRAIGKTATAISQEIERGSRDGAYDPQYAQQRATEKLSKGRDAMLADPLLATYVARLFLDEKLTALQVIQRLRVEKDNFKWIPSSVNTIYNAIDAGLIPGVTRESLRSDTIKMFSHGMICIPTWTREKLGLKDGDSFRIVVSPEGDISLQKIRADECIADKK